MTNETIKNHIYEQIDLIANAKDWHYVKGLIDMALQGGLVDYGTYRTFCHEADRKLSAISK